MFEKDTSLSIINNESRVIKLKVHEGHTEIKGEGEDQQAHLGISTRLTPRALITSISENKNPHSRLNKSNTTKQ